MADIKAIDKTTVHRICSGQVVLSLSVAVKELVENSLDAGATVIDVRLKEFGSELIEVADNGSGIHPGNFQGLTLKHHTSKIRDFSDLMSVETFGFRGEALSSLCALSDLSVITRHESQQCGTALVFDRNGHIVEEKLQARQIGTSVFVKNLFSTLPVRQKEFHKNLKREFHKMTQLLYAYCLVSTGVKILCINQTQKGARTTVMATQGSKTVKENISSLFGAKQLNSLLDIRKRVPPQEELEELKATNEDCEVFNIEGYISSCAHGAGKAAANRQFYFINSRPCEPSKIIKQVNQVYHQFNKIQYPFVFLNIILDRGLADVNVTPDKRQIFLLHEKLILAIIKASLSDLYEKIPSTLTVNLISPSISIKNDSQTAKPSLSRFEAWKHKSDLKRPSDSSNEFPQKLIKIEGPVQKTLESYNVKRKSFNVESFSESNLSNEVETVSQSEKEREANVSLNNLSSPKTSLSKSQICIDRTHLSASNLNNGINDNCIELQPISEHFHDQSDSQPILKNSSNEFGSVHFNIENQSEDLGKPDVEVSVPDCVPSQSTDEDDCENNSKSFVEHTVHLEDELKDSSMVVYDEFEERCARSVTYLVNLDSVKSALRKRIEESRRLIANQKCTTVKFHTTIDPSKNEEAEKELTKEISKDMFEKMEIIGQFNLGFIIAKLDSDLLIIDQHASDEKYNFETLQKTTVLNTQRLVVPQCLDLAAEHECILMDNIDIFHKNGFKFHIDEDAPTTKKISLTTIPMSKNMVFGKEDIDEMIFMLQDSQGSNCRPSRVRAMFASRACRKSVMIGTALSHRQMRQLINNMGTIEQPWNCPHGRPTIRHLLNLDLIKISLE